MNAISKSLTPTWYFFDVLNRKSAFLFFMPCPLVTTTPPCTLPEKELSFLWEALDLESDRLKCLANYCFSDARFKVDEIQVNNQVLTRSLPLVETNQFGTVDILFERDEIGVYRLNIAPHHEIPTHVHYVMNETEMVISHELYCQNKLVDYGSVREWPKGFPHRYENRSDQVQSILCIDRPKFIRDDEVPVCVTQLTDKVCVTH